MSIADLLQDLKNETQNILTPDFQVEVVETKTVPDLADSTITFANVEGQRILCKTIETCILFIDIRNSASISVERQPQTLARIYSSFVRSMILAARYFDGHVRDIIGDRLMVVFDRERCFQRAVDTAILMNTLSQYVIRPAVKRLVHDLEFRCGIGIDFGRMLVTKAGVPRKGNEREFYRSFVWLGKPANIASRLTDIAHKEFSYQQQGVSVGFYYPSTETWRWEDISYERFMEHLKPTYSQVLKYDNEYFSTFFKTSLPASRTTYPPILMTEAVYTGLKSENPDCDSVKKNLWAKQGNTIPEYTGHIYGGDVIFTAGKEL